MFVLVCEARTADKILFWCSVKLGKDFSVEKIASPDFPLRTEPKKTKLMNTKTGKSVILYFCDVPAAAV